MTFFFILMNIFSIISPSGGFKVYSILYCIIQTVPYFNNRFRA